MPEEKLYRYFVFFHFQTLRQGEQNVGVANQILTLRYPIYEVFEEAKDALASKLYEDDDYEDAEITIIIANWIELPLETPPAATDSNS